MEMLTKVFMMRSRMERREYLESLTDEELQLSVWSTDGTREDAINHILWWARLSTDEP